jgi:hypothetical protein
MQCFGPGKRIGPSLILVFRPGPRGPRIGPSPETVRNASQGQVGPPSFTWQEDRSAPAEERRAWKHPQRRGSPQSSSKGWTGGWLAAAAAAAGMAP